MSRLLGIVCLYAMIGPAVQLSAQVDLGYEIHEGYLNVGESSQATTIISN
jgi:hypothetical protein